MVVPLPRSAFDIAQRFRGIKEIAGEEDHPGIMWMLTLDNEWPDHDEVPWCSGFVNLVCHLMNLPRSYSLLARSWLGVGKGVPLADAEPGFDVVVLKRGRGGQAGPTNMTAPGHVGFYAGMNGNHIEVLGGNQSDQVKVSLYPKSKLLSVRRLV